MDDDESSSRQDADDREFVQASSLFLFQIIHRVKRIKETAKLAIGQAGGNKNLTRPNEIIIHDARSVFGEAEAVLGFLRGQYSHLGNETLSELEQEAKDEAAEELAEDEIVHADGQPGNDQPTSANNGELDEESGRGHSSLQGKVLFDDAPLRSSPSVRNERDRAEYRIQLEEERAKREQAEKEVRELREEIAAIREREQELRSMPDRASTSESDQTGDDASRTDDKGVDEDRSDLFEERIEQRIEEERLQMKRQHEKAIAKHNRQQETKHRKLEEKNASLEKKYADLEEAHKAEGRQLREKIDSMRNEHDGQEQSEINSSEEAKQGQVLLEPESEAVDNSLREGDVLLTTQQLVVRSIRTRLRSETIVIEKIRLAEVVVLRVEEAFNPRHPQLERIHDITRDLALLLHNMSRYKKMLKESESASENKDKLLDLDITCPVGAMALHLEKTTDTTNALPDAMRSLLANLKAAFDVHNSGKRYEVDDSPTFELSDEDNAKMRKEMFKLDLALENLLANCINIKMNVSVISIVDAGQLLLEDDERVMEQLEGLFREIIPDASKEAIKKSSLKYILETILLPSLLVEERKERATKLICYFTRELTNTGTRAKAEGILTAFGFAQEQTLAGGRIVCQEDFCGGEGRAMATRRRRIASIGCTMGLKDEIVRRLPRDKFPNGDFIQMLLTNSQTKAVEQCNFHSDQLPHLGDFFINSVHDIESGWVKRIKMKRHNIGAKAIIVDSSSIVGSLNHLLQR